MGIWKDFSTRTRDGRTVDMAWANVRLSDGTVLGVGQDMSERRRLEEAYLQAQKMEAFGRLAGGVAHDFNNLLGVITGYSEMALRQLEGNAAGRRIEEVLKAADRGAGLTRQLLAFSRSQVLAPKIVDLSAVVSDLGSLLQRVIGEDVEFAFRAGAEAAVVRVDPGQMGQVVMNLAVNARDAMPHGGSLTLETAIVDLDTPLAEGQDIIPPGAYATLSVSDTGEGIDPMNLPRIFEPFFTTKPVGEGTGLGLATVYGIVKQSGGYIQVRSELGRGTTFAVYLPRVADASASSAPRSDETDDLRGDETILVVEDQQALRVVIQDILRDRGYTVLASDAADTALAMAESHEGSIDLLLTDVVMPRSSGPELATRFAAVRPEAKILLMSGYTNDVLVRQGVAASGHSLMEKPFTIETLARKVRTVLGRRPAGQLPAAGGEGAGTQELAPASHQHA
jgi:two-component system, cell cycle sensor histidine kinase and response regulator CckA